MPIHHDYDMTNVRRQFQFLKNCREKTKNDLMQETITPTQNHDFRIGFAKGSMNAYDKAIECMLEIFGPCLEE